MSVVDNSDTGGVDLGQGSIYEDHVLTHGGAGTIAEGTILARNTTTQKWIPFVIGGVTDGDGIPGGVLTVDSVAVGAGDEVVRVLVHGKVNQTRLIEDGDGNGDNLTDAHFDVLRGHGITPVPVQQLSILDNQ